MKIPCFSHNYNNIPVSSPGPSSTQTYSGVGRHGVVLDVAGPGASRSYGDWDGNKEWKHFLASVMGITM